jgi:ProP effector
MTEALQATPDTGRAANTRNPPAPRQQQPRKANPVLERLFELYPALFGAQFLPLKLGVYKDLLALHPDDFKPEDLKVAMGLHARSMRYLEAVAAGHQRHGLDGNPVEPVAPEHVHHAMLEVFRRHQARTRDDLRPRLRVRLMAAIEASGLSCEDYAALVRVQDESTNALLDDAIAELGREAAKREALMRAFTASGRTEAEFAEMYGMDPVEVAAILARVRLDQSAGSAGKAPVSETVG